MVGHVSQKPLLMTGEDVEDAQLREIRESLERQWRVERMPALPETYEGFSAAVLQFGRPQPGEVARHCAEVRRRDDSVGLVVLAGHGELDHRLSALASGADEYLVANELTAREIHTRIRLTIAKRPLRVEAPSVCYGVFAVDLLRPVVRVQARAEELPLHQWQLMKCLVQSMGQIVAADDLCEFAGIQKSANHSNLQNAMSRLRRRLEGFSDQIATVKGVGYRIVG